MSEYLHLKGTLTGHSGWVTSIATTMQDNQDVLISGSRDRSLILWALTKNDPVNVGVPRKALTGHSHFVEDVVLSSDGQFALSCSWDTTLRLWDLNLGESTRTFCGHKKDALSVAFSSDNRQIVSGSRDKTLKLWNTLGECKHTIDGEGSGAGAHNEWVSCVRFSPNIANPLVVSGGWDKQVKVWNLRDCKLKTTFVGHTGYINCVTVAPDGSLCASGGKDQVAMLWDLNENKHLATLQAGGIIHALAFSPNRFWLCAATQNSIRIWDLQSHSVVTELSNNHTSFNATPTKSGRPPACLSLAWSLDGTTLYAGYTDNLIRVWEVRQ